MMMRRPCSLLLAAAAISACGSGDEMKSPNGKVGSNGDPMDELLSGAPDVDGYTIEVTGDPSEGFRTSGSGLEAEVGEATQSLSSPPVDLVDVRDAVRDLNGIVRAAMEPVVELVKTRSSSVGETRMFGPLDHGNGSYRFTLRRFAPKRFGWRLEARPKGAADSPFVVVMGGHLALGSVARRGRGAIGIDADALAAADSTYHSTGKLLASFAHGAGRAGAWRYSLRQFSANLETRPETVTGLYEAVRGPNGGTVVRLVTHKDVTGDGQKELVAFRVRWLPGVGGRFDGLATLGSIPQDRFDVLRGCFGPAFEARWRVVATCERAQDPSSCARLSVEGDRRDCVDDPRLAERLPPRDPEQMDDEAMDEGQERPDAPPLKMPDGLGN